MPRPCTICRRPDRKLVDTIITAGHETFSTMSRRFGTSQATLKRHKAAHLKPAVKRAASLREELSAQALVDRMVRLAQTTDDLLASAIAADDRGSAGKLIRESRENVMAIGRTLGLWQQNSGNVINIDQRTQIAALQGLTIDELRQVAGLSPRPALPGDIVDAEIVERVPGGQATDERNGPSDGPADARSGPTVP